MFTLLQDEKGSSIVLLTIGLTVFLGLTAFVADAGLLFIHDFQMTNALDAAALAGAQELPYRPTEAVNQALSYAAQNGIDTSMVNVSLSEDNKVITVDSQKQINFFFARFIGINNGMVSHTAKAQVASIVGGEGAAPLGIEKHDFEFGQEYVLKVGADDTTVLSDDLSSGWFGALALGAPGSSTYEENLTYGYDGNLKIGDIVDIQTGNISNPTKRAIDYRMTECKHIPTCTVEHFERDCPRLLKVPVIEPIDTQRVEIIGFSMFLVDAVEGQGIDNYITGKFVKTIASGEIDPTAEDFGLMGVRLIQ